MRGIHLIQRVLDSTGVRELRVVGQKQFERRTCAFRAMLRIARYSRYCASLSLKRTQIGSSGTIVVSGCAEFGVTSPPTGTSVSPTRPLMGERIVPYCRLRLAVSECRVAAAAFPSADCYLRIRCSAAPASHWLRSRGRSTSAARSAAMAASRSCRAAASCSTSGFKRS